MAFEIEPDKGPENACIPTCIKIVLDFARRSIPKLKNYKIEEIMKIMGTKGGGTKLRALEKLNKRLKTVGLGFKAESNKKIEDLKKLMANSFPPILIYDDYYFQSKISDSDLDIPSGRYWHAIVVTDIRDNEIEFVNPFFGNIEKIDFVKTPFLDAWAIAFGSIVRLHKFIKPISFYTNGRTEVGA